MEGTYRERVPFADEAGSVEAVAYRSDWPGEFEVLAARLRRLHLAERGAIEHVGSTSVPGLLAKDVIDIQVRVPVLSSHHIIDRFVGAGYRHRREEWNTVELTRTGRVPKLVFAPALGARGSNIHVRADGTCGARDALLFRDFLRADARARDAWADFKRAITEAIPQLDLLAYGQVKQPAWSVLMLAADAWAQAQEWAPDPLEPWPAVEQRAVSSAGDAPK
jgi:GrpB-like predicted nucleotidyltransferase (UPF0157 family)